MNAIKIGEVTMDLLRFLDEKELDGADKLAALKSAAALLEAVRSEETTKQYMQAVVHNALTPPSPQNK